MNGEATDLNASHGR